MILELGTSFGSVCGLCGKNSINKLTAFEVSKRTPYKLQCQCGNEIVSMKLDRNNKYKISVFCFSCGDTHEFTVLMNELFIKDKIELICPINKIGIFCFGKSEFVKKWNSDILKYIEEFADNDEFYDDDDSLVDAIDEFQDLLEYVPPADNLGVNSATQNQELILEKLNSLFFDKKLFCKCGNDIVKSNVYYDAFIMQCETCGTEEIIEFNDLERMMVFLNADTYILGRKWNKKAKKRGKYER